MGLLLVFVTSCLAQTSSGGVYPNLHCVYDDGNKNCYSFWGYVNTIAANQNKGCFFVFKSPMVPSVNIPYAQVAVSANNDPVLTPNNPVMYWDGTSLKNPANCQSSNAMYLMNDGVTWNQYYTNSNGQLSTFGSKFFYVTKSAGYNYLYFTVPTSSADNNIATVLNGKRVRLDLKCANYQGCITFFVNSTSSVIPTINFGNGTVSYPRSTTPGAMNSFSDGVNHGQPTTFLPGIQDYVFWFSDTCNNDNWALTWYLNSSATAHTPTAYTSPSPACPRDCNNQLFGNATGDVCGVCGGNNSTCKGCDGVPNSGKVNDACGVCGGNGTSCLGCDGTYWSGKVIDACGVCGGTNSTCKGCDGVPNSGKVNDSCGVCGGNNSCVGCDGVPNSGKKIDACGVCGGTNSTCKGCDGVIYSNKTVDQCGVCGGNNSCVGCDGVPNSGKKIDGCGVCGGFNQTCAGCDGIPYSNKTFDICGVCGGNGTSCSSKCASVVQVDYIMASNISIKDKGGFPNHQFEFCYAVNGTKQTDAIVVGFQPFKACSLETARDTCSNRINESPLPANYCTSFQPGVYLNTSRWIWQETQNQQGVWTEKYCANFTFNDLNSYCRNSSGSPILSISNVDTAGSITTYQGTFYAAVVQANDCSNRSKCEMIEMTQESNFTIQVGMSGTVSFNYLAQGINLQALIRSVYFIPSGDVCIKFETIVAHIEQNLPTIYNTTFLSNATMNTTLMTGVPFQITDTENYCDPDFPNSQTYCTQLWTICSTGGSAYNDFSGMKPVQYNLYVKNSVRQQVTVNLKVGITRNVDVGNLHQDLNAFLQLYKDASFQTQYNPNTDGAFIDCSQICGVLSLDVPQQTLNCFNLTIDKVTVCSSTSGNLLAYDPQNPTTTGCNTVVPNNGVVLKNVVYDITKPGQQLSNYDAKFVFEHDPPYTTGQMGFCFESRAFTQFNSLVQINWHSSAVNSSQCTLIGFQGAQAQDNDDNVPCIDGQDAQGHPCGPNGDNCTCGCGCCSGNSGHCLDECGECQGDGSSCDGAPWQTCTLSTTAPPTTSPATTSPATTLPTTTSPGTTSGVTTSPAPTTTAPSSTTTAAPTTTSPATTSPTTTSPSTTSPGGCSTCTGTGNVTFVFTGNGTSLGIFFVVCQPGCVFVPGIGCTNFPHLKVIEFFDNWGPWTSLIVLLIMMILFCILLGGYFNWGPTVRRRRRQNVVQQVVVQEEDDHHHHHHHQSDGYHAQKRRHHHNKGHHPHLSSVKPGAYFV